MKRSSRDNDDEIVAEASNRLSRDLSHPNSDEASLQVTGSTSENKQDKRWSAERLRGIES